MPEHNILEHKMPEHNILEHKMPEHNMLEHNILEHKMPEHTVTEVTRLHVTSVHFISAIFWLFLPNLANAKFG